MHNLKHPQTLCFIGLIQPLGGLLPISELQSRWFALLNTGKLKLASFDRMKQDIKNKENEIQQRYYQSERHTIQVDWLPFMVELAKEIGINPSIWKYLITDFKLFWALVFGASVSYQFRLTGMLG